MSRKMILFACLLYGCAHDRADVQVPRQPISCTVGQRCDLSGRLTVHRGVPASVAELDVGGACFPVALDESDYVRLANRRGIKVRVLGTAFASASAGGVVSYSVRDRQVAAGICQGSPVIYVERLTPEL